jgi:serine/threonine protein phosphatase PrpC
MKATKFEQEDSIVAIVFASIGGWYLGSQLSEKILIPLLDRWVESHDARVIREYEQAQKEAAE